MENNQPWFSKTNHLVFFIYVNNTGCHITSTFLLLNNEQYLIINITSWLQIK